MFCFLPFNNYWHYYLSGESIYFDAFKNNYKGKEVALTEADILIDLGNGINKLYKGIITQHTICRSTGDLKYIYLTQCRRFKILENNDGTRDIEIKEVPGDIMLIPNEKIINMNLTYITRDKKKIDYLGMFTGILGILSILISFIDPFNILNANLTIIGWILGRFWLFVLSIFIIAFLENILRKNIKFSKMYKAGQSLFLLFFIFLITYIVFKYFSNRNLLFEIKSFF